ncbi:hypothetical protein K458DRAFT_406643 [Lentithecium fluviatile CBS 122367]|uniref:MARVEL domain-containing protein n=1 Tax=Lentithecium fluviatile CBS 122367 TaxID=1168545 RepID=A0A6G1IT07_9PLEO|nr:hypothetical protein K458DRAFT_406643 [Lentithecium fluviatile CBS 122367]
MVNNAEPPPHVLRVPKWVLAIHAAQVVFAIIILGLSAYGVHWIAYNVLIYALVVCICTFGVCAYLIASQLFLHKLYNMWVALGLHLWMLLFWVVDLGLVANLARLWSLDSYSYLYGYSYSWDYSDYYKRDLQILNKRDDTFTYDAYYGALAAGSVFAAVEFVSWIACTVLLILAWNKHRQNTANTTQTNPAQPPPQYAANTAQPAADVEKYGQTGVQAQPQQFPQQQYAQPVQQQQYSQQQPQAYYPQQPVQQQAPYGQQQQLHPTGPYPQDPVPRQDTVSPMSQAGYYPAASNVSELSSPQHTGGAYPPNASELGGQQQTQQQAYYPDVPELSERK